MKKIIAAFTNRMRANLLSFLSQVVAIQKTLNDDETITFQMLYNAYASGTFDNGVVSPFSRQDALAFLDRVQAIQEAILGLGVNMHSQVLTGMLGERKLRGAMNDYKNENILDFYRSSSTEILMKSHRDYFHIVYRFNQDKTRYHRYYLHIAPDHIDDAIPVFVSELVSKFKDKFLAIKFGGLKNLLRCDSCVIYCEPLNELEKQQFGQFLKKNLSWFIPSESPWVLPIFPGVGFARDDRSNGSFGMEQSRILKEAIDRLKEMPAQEFNVENLYAIYSQVLEENGRSVKDPSRLIRCPSAHHDEDEDAGIKASLDPFILSPKPANSRIPSDKDMKEADATLEAEPDLGAVSPSPVRRSKRIRDRAAVTIDSSAKRSKPAKTHKS